MDRTRRSKKFPAALVGVALVLTVLAAPVFAGGKGAGGKGHGGTATTGGGTIELRLIDTTDAVASFQEQVTFAVSTTATDMPYVHLVCSQGSSVVAEGRQGFFDSALGNQWFTLGPTPAWQGGDAQCTAYLEKYTTKGWQQLASTTFPVVG